MVAALIPYAALGDAAGSPYISTYPSSYFAAMQPYSAFDMLAATPGFTFAEVDAKVRGLAGAEGNVLIDGARLVSKHESLEATLRRIPVSAVERIELIRSGAPRVDMQGHAVLANVVRVRRARREGAVELASTFYRGFVAPRMAAEWSRETPLQRLALSTAAYDEAGEEHGVGRQPNVSADGALLEDARFAQDERERVLEMSGALERRLSDGMLRANGSVVRERSKVRSVETQIFPDAAVGSDRKREREREIELGAQYEHASAQDLRFEWLALHRRTGEREREESVAATEHSFFTQLNDARETIVRGRIRRTLSRGALELGAEGAHNVLEGHSKLEENGVAAALPAADVRVEELRGEVFAAANHRLDAHWTLEGAARFEYSELQQTGDSNLRKSFFFPKPRVLLSYASDDADLWRVVIERRVGQLDFEDFISSTSLTVDTFIAGNPQLEPDRSWVAELAWEHRWRTDAALSVVVRREWISHLIDRTPIVVSGGELRDGVGNIGEAVRDELEISLTLPLAFIGLETAMLKGDGLWREGRATDPMTGERREISEEPAFEGAVHFTHDLTALKVRWGVDAELGGEARQFLLDEVRSERLGAQIDVFAEYKPTPSWNIRIAANNLADRKFERERWRHDGPRGVAPLEFIETRTLRMGPYYSLSVRRSFGR